MKALSKAATDAGLSIDDDSFAKKMDELDPCAKYRSQFLIPKHNDQEALYLCGNSLGLQPVSTRSIINEELDLWARRGVEGHFEGARPWVHTDLYVKEQMAHIVGALPAEVSVMNGLTVNLHLMMVPFYQPTKTRFKILVAGGEFPSDRYAVQSQIELRGFKVEDALVQVRPRADENTIRTEDIEAAIEQHGDSIALVLFSGVHYYTGQLFQMERIAAAAHGVGSRVGFDLAHAVGNAHLKLHDWNVDFAVWCSYKYLNSGPGGIAGAFIHQRLHEDKTLRGLSGWWGQKYETRFDMLQPFDPIPGPDGFRLSNPPVFQVASLFASVSIFEEVGMEALRAKSVKLTGYLEYLLLKLFSRDEVSIITPSNPEERGCQLSLQFTADLTEVKKALDSKGVICDVRKPSVMRIAPTPLYNTFQDVYQFVSLVREVLKE